MIGFIQEDIIAYYFCFCKPNFKKFHMKNKAARKKWDCRIATP